MEKPEKAENAGEGREQRKGVICSCLFTPYLVMTYDEWYLGGVLKELVLATLLGPAGLQYHSLCYEQESRIIDIIELECNKYMNRVWL